MKIALLILTIVITLAGCNSGDFRAETAIKGQPAAITGYNVGPELYVEQGQPCPVSGVIIWIKGLDPNDLR